MPEDSLLHALQEYVHRNRLIERGDKLVLAISGGIDSMALLDLFQRLRHSYNLELVAAHCNHQLRGSESELDEQFVRERTKDYGLEIYVECVNTRGIAESQHRSIQETARDLRLKFFTEVRASLGYANIVTAHHTDDNAETILFNFFRGSGVHGLSGIPMRREDLKIIRPLLFATREQIAGYMLERNLPFREDSSNTKNIYTRNYIRHDLLPLIRENINPNITATINRSAEIFRALEIFLQSEIERIYPTLIVLRNATTIHLDRDKLLASPPYLQEYLLKRAMQEHHPGDVDFSTIKSLIGIVHSDTGAYCTLQHNIVFYRDRNTIVLKTLPTMKEFTYAIARNQSYEFEMFRLSLVKVEKTEFTNNPFVEYIDADKLGARLAVRNWKHGDWFIPFGKNQKKKLSDFFIDAKVPLFEKDSVAILESDNEIVWVCGYRLDNRFKVTPATKNTIKMEYQTK
ncbi:MAG: tRNA lysidine(34) synthetase TilS [Bacteroidota bacterium]